MRAYYVALASEASSVIISDVAGPFPSEVAAKSWLTKKIGPASDRMKQVILLDMASVEASEEES